MFDQFGSKILMCVFISVSRVLMMMISFEIFINQLAESTKRFLQFLSQLMQKSVWDFAKWEVI